MSKAKPNVFIGTKEIAGYYAGLTCGFKAIDVPVTRFLRQAHRFAYDDGTQWENLLQRLGQRYRGASKKARILHPLLAPVPAFEAVLTKRIIASHDIFIFGAMTSLDGVLTGGARLEDLKLIKAAGKTVICVFHGSEVRPPWLNGSFRTQHPDALIASGRRLIARLRTIEAYADIIVSHPPMAPLQQVPYAQYLAVGIPMEKTRQLSSRNGPEGNRPLKLVHAPSNPEAKGTERIKEVIERIRSKGYSIDLRLLSNVPHAEVMAALSQADLLVDQVFSDTPMAHLAAEAATQGCPSVVGGYDLAALREATDPAIWPPSITGKPEDLYDLVLWAIENAEERRRIGAAAEAYVSSNWTAEKVARNFLRLAEEGIPEAWRVDPVARRFWGGYGMTLDQRDEMIARVVAAGGIESLFIPDGLPLPLPRS